MRYHALACDYDGTVATDGRLLDDTRRALDRLRSTGRKIVLVTGRRLDDLQRVCPNLSPFDVVVAENGALLHWPATHEIRALAEPPPAIFAETLVNRGVPDVSCGHVIVATWQPHETTVLDVIRELGLEMQVIFNKGAVMMLPSGINKATGLAAALESLRLSPHNVVGVGDAENDHALLTACECGVAVANALPMVKERADFVTTADHGAGVAELADRMVRDDLNDVAPRLSRHDLPVGTEASSGAAVTLPSFGINVMLAGTSGGGKSTFATAFLEKLDERKYQYCLLDPEGDYGEVPGAVVLGTQKAPPGLDELEKLLDKPGENAVAALLGLGMDDRPALFEAMLPRLQLQRARCGRPHWIIVDEAHHLAPQDRNPPLTTLGDVTGLFLITVHPKHVARALLERVDVLVVIGVSPRATISELAAAIGATAPDVDAGPLDQGEALLWWPRHQDRGVTRFRAIAPASERRRHIRKYAEGDLPPDRSFYFRGPEGKLNLRAQNLMSFLQIGDGVDDDTWIFHLRAGDYSAWLGRVVKDRALADEVAGVERDTRDSAPSASRRAVRVAIEKRYTAPA